jgi:hypothetical protein
VIRQVPRRLAGREALLEGLGALTCPTCGYDLQMVASIREKGLEVVYVVYPGKPADHLCIHS